MRAWYLGLVGDAAACEVVAYESALMFDPVKDVLTIPSYCRDVPFYWTQKPLARLERTASSRTHQAGSRLLRQRDRSK
jgi:hypothetical protein